ncbi:hypothetical protein AB0392_59895 [Nonomuraea angiospora]|uniref:hypothetical protein n=1 Tax=Nonomuraea angiospora TaxID=46172 RepID=UPI00344E908C
MSESFTGWLTAFDIAPDGTLSIRRLWADGLGPDGITVDTSGAVWVQTGGQPAHGARGGSAGQVNRIGTAIHAKRNAGAAKRDFSFVRWSTPDRYAWRGVLRPTGRCG